MDPESSGLAQIAQRLDDEGIVWAVFAGAAASVYGTGRPWADVDILVAAADGERVAALFPGAALDLADGRIKRISLSNVDILAGLTSMDLDSPMAKRLVRREIEGAPAPLIPPEDNILLKALWGRGSEQDKQDWDDVEAMMAHQPALDWNYLRWRAATMGEPARMRPLVARLERLWQALHE